MIYHVTLQYPFCIGVPWLRMQRGEAREKGIAYVRQWTASALLSLHPFTLTSWTVSRSIERSAEVTCEVGGTV
jgi:hypothetical protein